MRFFFRHFVILLGVFFLLTSISGCASDTKKFAEISNGFAKSINLLNKEPGIRMSGISSDPDKKYFNISISIEGNIMTEEHLKQVIESYLTNVASFTSEHDPQKLLKPYNLKINEIVRNEIGPPYIGLIAEKPSGSTVISWKTIEGLTTRYEEKPLVEHLQGNQ